MIITEQALRSQLKGHTGDTYYLPKGGNLTPSARDYLNQRRLKITREQPIVEEKVVEKEVTPAPIVEPASPQPVTKLKYVDYETGAYYHEKPEYMTQLNGNQLVDKDHPRIAFRGKMDSLQALLVLAQVSIQECNKPKLVSDLDDIYKQFNIIMRCDVLDEPCESSHIIGLNHKELRERSHHPMKYFQIKQLLLANYTMGKEHALLNQIRAGIREAEVMATAAFRAGNKHQRTDIVQHLNRLSSALHIMCCMYLAGLYDN